MYMVLRLDSFSLVSIFCEAILEVLQRAVVSILPAFLSRQP